MKKSILMLAFIVGASSAFVSCRDQNTTKDGESIQIEDDTIGNNLEKAAKDAGDAVENAARETGQAVESAAEETGKAVENAAEETADAAEKTWDEAKEKTGIDDGDNQ